MKIVQLSDVHVGPQFKEETFETAVREVNEINPDVVMITGDLTENGLIKEYKRARELVDTIDCDKKIFCSGNHDYLNTGYLSFKKFFPSTNIEDFGDVVICTLNTARPDRHDGEVGYRQNMWMYNSLSEFNGKKKIIAMHHHLISVPQTGGDKITIVDAGDTLQAILLANVDAVLCGHRHRPWMWHLGPLIIANAGATSTERMRGFFENTYNIINVGENVEVDLKIIGGKQMPLSELVKMHNFKENNNSN